LSDADELLPWVRQRLLRQARERARDAERRMHAADANAARWQVVAALAVAVAPCRDFDGFLAKVIDILAAPLGLTTAALYERDRGHFVLAAPAGGPAMPGHGPRFASFPVQISGSRDGMLTLGRVAAFTVADRTLIEQLRAPLTGAVARLRADATGPLLAASRLRCAHLLVHDFKNLIGAVSANLELLAHGDRLHLTPAGRSEATRGAAAATDRLRQLTLDLLDIASAEDEALAIAPHATDLSALALEAIAHWRGVIVTRRVRLALDLPEDLVAEVDARLVIRVFWNLLDNALRCVPEGGRIEFGARREADQLVFRVGHEDRAIPPAQRDRLFEPYWRSPEVVDPQHHGLGLYFCKVVVEAHGGTIEARDRPGGGTEFEFTLRSPRA
jgi:signal transduction histidine kinase